MENASGPSSEEELVQLRNEGKITEAEYQQLLEALRKPSLSDLRRRPRVFRERFLWMSVAAIFIIATVLSLTVVVIRRSQNIDLIVEDQSLEVRPYSEGGLHFVVIPIRNKGSVSSPEFRFYFYQGDPRQSEPVDHSAGPIKPDDIWNAVSAPFALKEGINEIVVVLDPHNQVKESDETNNRTWLHIILEEGQIIETDANTPVG
jgi:hypothetical protein